MPNQDLDQQVRTAFDNRLAGAAADTPCSIYLASASDASSLGDAIQSHFGDSAKAFYDALVQIAAANCGGGATK